MTTDPGAASALVTVGLLLLASLFARWLGIRIGLPRVTLLLIVGVLSGPLVLDALPPQRESWFPVASRIALVMVGFLIGGEFTRDRLRQHGRQVGVLTVGQGVTTAVVVAGGLLLAGVDPTIALLLGGVATATDPAATRSVVEEEGDGEGSSEGARTLLGVVALDDVIGIIAFSVLITAAGVAAGDGGVLHELGRGGWELAGGALVGVALGVPASKLTGRVRPGEPTREEALALVLLCAGVTWWLDVSYLLAAVVLGVVVANLASHHERPFREIEGIEWPFLVVFFVLAGAELDRDALGASAVLAGYVVLRAAGKVVGASASARPAGVRGGPWIGAALLPQAGVAVGMALAGAERFPEHASVVVGVAVASTVLFEVVGPVVARTSIHRLADGETD